jgi:hypothetical protein
MNKTIFVIMILILSISLATCSKSAGSSSTANAQGTVQGTTGEVIAQASGSGLAQAGNPTEQLMQIVEDFNAGKITAEEYSKKVMEVQSAMGISAPQMSDQTNTIENKTSARVIADQYRGEFRLGDDLLRYNFITFSSDSFYVGRASPDSDYVTDGGISWTVGNELMTARGKFGTFIDINTFVVNSDYSQIAMWEKQGYYKSGVYKKPN